MLGTRLSNIIVLKTYILTFEGISNFSSQYELLVVHISFLSVGTSLNRIDKNSTTAYIYVHFFYDYTDRFSPGAATTMDIRRI